MKTSGFVYYPSTRVQFTKAEVDVLMKASRQHYDFDCRRQCEPGGIIYGLQNRLERDGAWAEPIASCVMTTSDLDLLSKVAERDSAAELAELYTALVAAVREGNAEYIKLNGGRS